MTEDDRTPMLTADELPELGYDIVLFPATGFNAVLKTLQYLCSEIVETGTQQHRMDRLINWRGRNESTGLEEITELEQKYSLE